MSFQAYLTTIKQQTGMDPDDFRRIATQKGYLHNGQINEGIKAAEIVTWLKEDFKLGHGHAMAIYALFKGIKNESDE
jgi:hypothetical protein